MATAFLHFEQARRAAIDELRLWLQSGPAVDTLMVIDLYGHFRLIWFDNVDEFRQQAISTALTTACGPWWSGEVLTRRDLKEPATGQVFRRAWDDGLPDESGLPLRVLERHRSRTSWFAKPAHPAWEAPEGGPPVVAFYSFKGGMGRSTLLAAIAIQRAQAGERVCVIDLDLDSPGIGRLLAADDEGTVSPWGVVDYLAEYREQNLRFDDYWHRCDRVAGSGQILVMPSGTLDRHFADKLARADLEAAAGGSEGAFARLLQLTHQTWNPDWILLDARTGISEVAGHVLSGVAHTHVLLATAQAQSWQGIERVVERLGADRLRLEVPQASVLLVQTLVPGGPVGDMQRERFAGLAEAGFDAMYYGKDGEWDADRFWVMADKADLDAPHRPMHLSYDPDLAAFVDIEDVQEKLKIGTYAAVGERLAVLRRVPLAGNDADA